MVSESCASPDSKTGKGANRLGETALQLRNCHVKVDENMAGEIR